MAVWLTPITIPGPATSRVIMLGISVEIYGLTFMEKNWRDALCRMREDPCAHSCVLTATFVGGLEMATPFDQFLATKNGHPGDSDRRSVLSFLQRHGDTAVLLRPVPHSHRVHVAEPPRA
jgi:hypothetical protein